MVIIVFLILIFNFLKHFQLLIIYQLINFIKQQFIFLELIMVKLVLTIIFILQLNQFLFLSQNFIIKFLIINFKLIKRFLIIILIMVIQQLVLIIIFVLLMQVIIKLLILKIIIVIKLMFIMEIIFILNFQLTYFSTFRNNLNFISSSLFQIFYLFFTFTLLKLQILALYLSLSFIYHHNILQTFGNLQKY